MNPLSGSNGDRQTTSENIADVLEFVADALMNLKQTNERTLNGAGLVLLTCREALNTDEHEEG